jgi:hypothetical protein
MSDESTRTPATICWHCDRMLDAATGFGPTEGEVPTPGAISLCLYCGAVGVFGSDLELMPATVELLDELVKDAEFRKAFTTFAWARQYEMIKNSLMRDREDPDR